MASATITTDMAALERVANSLKNMDLNRRSAKHTLHIDFPAEDLLPPGVSMTLNPPANAQQREAPPVDQRRLGYNKTDVVIFIPVLNRPVPHADVPNNEISLHEATTTMGNRPGVSYLAAVTFYDEELDAEVLRIYISTKFALAGRSRNHEFDLTAEEWNHIVGESCAEGQEWAVRLDDLITRGTDRAYYHVHNNLIAGLGKEAALAEESRWVDEWGSKRLRQLERSSTTVAEIDTLMRDAELSA